MLWLLGKKESASIAKHAKTAPSCQDQPQNQGAEREEFGYLKIMLVKAG